MSAVLHAIAVKRTCLRCVVTENNVISDPMVSKTSLKDMNMARGSSLEISSKIIAGIWNDNRSDVVFRYC